MLNINDLDKELEKAEKFMQHAFDAANLKPSEALKYELAVWEQHRDKVQHLIDKVQDRIDQYHYEAGLARAAALRGTVV